MPTYIMLSTLTPEGIQTVKNNPQRIREVNREVEQLGAEVKAQWATLGVVRLRQRDRGARRQDDGADLARARLARHRPLRDADRDPDRRFHRRAVTQGPGHRRRGPRARDRARAAALAAAARRCSARPGNAGIARDAPPFDGADDPAAIAAAGIDLVVVGPEAPLVAGFADARGAASPCSARAPTAAQLEGSKAYAKEVMVAAGVPTADYTVVAQRRGRAARHRALSRRAEGRRAGRGQGRRDRGRRGRGARRRSTDMLVGQALRRRAGGGRGVPGGRRAVRARAVRRRVRAAARPGARLQAHRRGRHRPEHRRHGRVLAGRRRRRGADRATCGPRSASRSSTSSRAAARRSTACSTRA